MAEYIERDRVIDLFDDGKWQGQICVGAVKEIPSADVAPVVRGQWIIDSSDEYANHYHCDQCQKEIDLCNEIYVEPTPNYCPNCGAKMKKEDEQ